MTQLESNVEQELIHKAQAGDKTAFDQLLSHYLPLLTEYAQSALGDYDKAQDASQTTMIWAWTNLSTFSYKPFKFKHWLLAACKNHNRDVQNGRVPADDMYYRLKREQGIFPPSHNAENAQNDYADGYRVLNVPQSDIELAVQKLSPTLRKVWLLHQDGLSNKEISERLEMKYPNVKKCLQRARKRMTTQPRSGISPKQGDKTGGQKHIYSREAVRGAGI